MNQYLSTMMAISDIFLILDGSPEAKVKKAELWSTCGPMSAPGFTAGSSSPGRVTNLKIPGGDKITVFGYRLARKIVKFN